MCDGCKLVDMVKDGLEDADAPDTTTRAAADVVNGYCARVAVGRDAVKRGESTPDDEAERVRKWLSEVLLDELTPEARTVLMLGATKLRAMLGTLSECAARAKIGRGDDDVPLKWALSIAAERMMEGGSFTIEVVDLGAEPGPGGPLGKVHEA